MVDVVTPDVRSRMMAGIKGKDTKPELVLRSGLHRAGFRFRLHDKTLPGKPDLAFPRHRAVLFVNGCFWHGHDCHLFKMPATRTEFWAEKISRNRAVDEGAAIALEFSGWRVGTVWECSLKGRMRRNLDEVIDICADWLRGGDAALVIRGTE